MNDEIRMTNDDTVLNARVATMTRQPMTASCGPGRSSLITDHSSLIFRHSSYVIRHSPALLFFLLGIALAGCLADRTRPPGQRATDIHPREAQPAFWMDQPGVASVEHPSFDRLWNACQHVARRHLFTIDRVDPRNGVLTTHPLVSRQFFEIWRNDTATVADAAQSSLGTVRRTIRFEVERTEDGSYVAWPKVLIERYIAPERRYTTTLQYAGAFMQPELPVGPRQADAAAPAPGDYWYALGRDHALEQRLADAIDRHLR